MHYIENSNVREGIYVEGSEFVNMQIYEVLRVVDGVALFAEDHFARFQASCELMQVKNFPNQDRFKRELNQLIELNDLHEGNVKIDYSLLVNGHTRFCLRVIPHQYPSAQMYEQGVTLALLHAERTNPQAKVLQSVRELADGRIRECQCYEVLLVDQQNRITEGSRSNVFFIKGDEFFTAPDALVLSGITRLKVMDCIRSLGYGLREQAVGENELGACDAVFLTGTSPKILPVSQVEELSFASQSPKLRELMDAYDALISVYVLAKKG